MRTKAELLSSIANDKWRIEIGTITHTQGIVNKNKDCIITIRDNEDKELAQTVSFLPDLVKLNQKLLEALKLSVRQVDPDILKSKRGFDENYIHKTIITETESFLNSPID